MLEINDNTDTLGGVSYSRKINAVVAKPLMQRRISCGGAYISIKLNLLSSGLQSSLRSSYLHLISLNLLCTVGGKSFNQSNSQ